MFDHCDDMAAILTFDNGDSSNNRSAGQVREVRGTKGGIRQWLRVILYFPAV
jgi:hypothetical protein